MLLTVVMLYKQFMLIKFLLTMYWVTDAPLKNPICKVFTSTINKKNIYQTKSPTRRGKFFLNSEELLMMLSQIIGWSIPCFHLHQRMPLVKSKPLDETGTRRFVVPDADMDQPKNRESTTHNIWYLYIYKFTAII